MSTNTFVFLGALFAAGILAGSCGDGEIGVVSGENRRTAEDGSGLFDGGVEEAPSGDVTPSDLEPTEPAGGSEPPADPAPLPSDPAPPDPAPPSPCLPETCLSLGLECGEAGDGCGGTITCGSCAGGANVLWSSTEQTQGSPFQFDWITCESPIGSTVSCTNGDGDGAEFGVVANPDPGGTGSAIRQYADLSAGGGRSQSAVLSQAQPAIDALFDNQEEVWFYMEYYFPAPVVGSGWYHFFGFQQTGTAGRQVNNPAINFWADNEDSGGHLPGDMEIGIYWWGSDASQTQKASAPMPVGKWTEFEYMYKRSSGNDIKDGASQIWIDDVLVLDQGPVDTWEVGYENLEAYWNLYGEAWSYDWDEIAPVHYFRNVKIGDAKMSTGHLR